MHIGLHSSWLLPLLLKHSSTNTDSPVGTVLASRLQQVIILACSSSPSLPGRQAAAYVHMLCSLYIFTYLYLARHLSYFPHPSSVPLSPIGHHYSHLYLQAEIQRMAMSLDPLKAWAGLLAGKKKMGEGKDVYFNVSHYSFTVVSVECTAILFPSHVLLVPML